MAIPFRAKSFGRFELQARVGSGGMAEVFKANHGWTMPDSAVYNKEEADRAWVQRLALYKSALV